MKTEPGRWGSCQILWTKGVKLFLQNAWESTEDFKHLRMFVDWFTFYIDHPGCFWKWTEWMNKWMNGGRWFSGFIIKKSAGESLTPLLNQRHRKPVRTFPVASAVSLAVALWHRMPDPEKERCQPSGELIWSRSRWHNCPLPTFWGGGNVQIFN